MAYTDLDFRGSYIYQERQRVNKEGLIAASFTAWQMLCSQVKKPPTWRNYIKSLGLVDELPNSKEDLKREAEQAMENAERIIARANNVGR